MPEILMKTICPLERYITLTQARQINLDYNTCLSNQVEKRISPVEQSNKSIAYIFVCIDVIIEQEVPQQVSKNSKYDNEKSLSI